MERFDAIDEQERWAHYAVGTTPYDREFAKIYFDYQRWEPPPSLEDMLWFLKTQSLLFMLTAVVFCEATTAFGDSDGRIVAEVACGAAAFRVIRMPLYYWTTVRVHGLGFLKRMLPVMHAMFEIKAWWPYWYYRSPVVAFLMFAQLGTLPFLVFSSTLDPYLFAVTSRA